MFSGIASKMFTESVVGLAGRFAEVRDTPEAATQAAILADALEEAGYADVGTLAALRSGTVSYRTAEDIGHLADGRVREGFARAETTRLAREKKDAREQKYADARRDTALAVGARWHATVADLFTSVRAAVVYGRGGEEVVDWDAYGKRGYANPHTGKRQPAKYRNAGARIVGFGRSGRIVLESSRGTEVARLPLPPADAVIGGGACLGGELFTTRRVIAGVTVATRFVPRKVRGSKTEHAYAPTGLAVRLPIPAELAGQSVVFGAKSGATQYWEHGDTVRIIRAEYARKLGIAAANKVDEERRQADTEQSAREEAKEQRRAVLFARIATRTPVTYDDARAVGMCDAGIRAFAAKLGITDTTATVPLAEVFRREPERAVLLARRILSQRQAQTAA